MNKNPDTLARRSRDLINEINNRPSEHVATVISEFAERHYLSESTCWKDYKNASSTDGCGSNSKRY